MKLNGISKDEVESFLNELTALSNKYNIALDACSCCEQISLYKPKENGKYIFEEDTFNKSFNNINFKTGDKR